jgi:hypothetical protein
LKLRDGLPNFKNRASQLSPIASAAVGATSAIRRRR